MIVIKNIELEKAASSIKKAEYIIDGNLFKTEQAAAHHFESQGYETIQSENFYWWYIAALLFWDVIFSKVEGAVALMEDCVQTALHPQHDQYNYLFEKIIALNGMPADFFSEEFYFRRKSLFSNKIKELENSDICSALTNVYKRQYGSNCRMIGDWELFSLEQLLVPINKLDKNSLLQMLHRVMQNVTDKRKGLPDLCIYNDNEFLFCEVKSENDTIQEHQKEWHEFLSNTLGFKVILLLINQKKSKVDSIHKKYLPNGIPLKFSISKKSCSNRHELINILKDQSSYLENDEQISVELSVDEKNIELIFKILEQSSGIRQRQIEVQGKKCSPSELKTGLSCCLEKIKQKASSGYCDGSIDYGKRNPLGCKKVRFSELQYNYWDKYGYVNTENGEWVFDKSAIQEELNRFIVKFRFCPFFNEKALNKLVEKLPDKVSPKVDSKWAFLSNESETWLWQNEKWITTDCQDEFPGYNMMVGVHKITKSERNKAEKEYIQYRKDEEFIHDIKTSSSDMLFDEPQKKKDACFIATAVYGNENHPFVLALRHYRDYNLKKSIIGIIFIYVYYLFGPHLAKVVSGIPHLRKIVNIILNHIVLKLCKKSGLE